MMPATKHYDPVVGLDTHIIQPPGPVPPVPVPHPFVGMILDPMDYVPIVGSTVNINFLPRALAGTQGIATPPHIPLGGVFIKPPANECECYMGVSTINCDGDALCHMSLPVLSCQCIGMPPVPRIRKKGAIKSLVLPTSVVLSIPAGPPVIIAGPPTISLMALGTRMGMGALGKAFKKFKASKLGKKVGDKFDSVKSKFKKKTPSANKGCGRPGEPVDVVTGANVDDFVDWESPKLPHLRWQRFYSTLMSDQAGPLGYGFRHNWQHELRKAENGFVYRDPEGESVGFPPLNSETNSCCSLDGWMLRLEERTGQYELSSVNQPILWFERDDRRAMNAHRLEVHGRGLSLSYDEHARLMQVSDPQSNQLQLSYDRHGHLIQVDLHVGHERQTLVSYAYDGEGCLSVWNDALDQEGKYSYDANHCMTKKTDRNGYSYHYRYDEAGHCIQSWGDDGLYEIQLEYFPEDLFTLVTWADGARYEYHYDESGVLSKIVDPAGGVRLFETDETGNIILEVEPNGDEVNYLYDQHGAHTHRIDASGQLLLPMHKQPHRPDGLAYELPNTPMGWTLGEHASSKAAEARVLDQLLEKTFPGTDLDGVNEVAAWTPQDAIQHTDLLGRVVEEQNHANCTTAYNYDPNGNVIRKRDADGALWSYHYKSWNLLDEERNPAGATIKYDYNLREAITRMVDPGGTVTEYEYDGCDRLIQVSRGGKIRDRYAFTAGGHLCQKFDSSGELLFSLEPGPYDTYSKIELSDGECYEYKHTERARIAAASCPDHSVQLEYDLFDQVKQDFRDGLGVTHAWSDPQTRVQTLLDKFQTRYRTTKSGTLELIDPSGSITSIAADGRGRFLRTNTDGLSELVCYDRRGLCASQIVAFPSGGTWTRSYRYSSAGDLLHVVDSQSGSAEYKYDTAHRLISRRRGGREDVYRHDAANNLLAKPGLSAVKLGKANQLAAAEDESFEYNQRDHLSLRQRNDGTAHHYKYNSLDQLVEVTSEDGFHWSAKYDGLNRRISKEWTTGFESHNVEFYWDHRRLAAEILDGQRLRLYLYGDRKSFVPLMMVEYDSLDDESQHGARYHLLSDQRGQIIRVMDAEGLTAWETASEAYGEVPTTASRAFQFALRLPGQYADDEINLYYNRHRYFDPGLGRFIQSDPIGLAGGMNTYAFPTNPFLHVDLEGLHPDGPSKSSGGGDAPKAVESPPKKKPSTEPSISPEDQALRDLGTFKGKKRREIQRRLREQGYKSHKNGNSKIYTKDLGNGSTAAVRLDPATKRVPSKNFADEVPHAHKEIVPSDQVANGNYLQPNKAKGVKKFDDGGNPNSNPAAIHIPIQTRK